VRWFVVDFHTSIELLLDLWFHFADNPVKLELPALTLSMSVGELVFLKIFEPYDRLEPLPESRSRFPTLFLDLIVVYIFVAPYVVPYLALPTDLLFGSVDERAQLRNHLVLRR